MLLINVHQLDVVLADTIVLCALECEVDDIWCILRLECKDVLALCASKDLGEGGQVDTKSEISIAAEW